MKRFSLLCVLAILCSLPAYSQFWISFGWNEPHCQNCLWMEQAMHLPAREAAEYHKIIHKYGQKIEKEARRDYRYWDRAARRIYDLRMERDRKIQRLLTPAQFNLYVRFVREHPQRIHDYRGWYANPRYPDRRPSHDCRRYEDNYWNYRWGTIHHDNHWRDDRHDSDRHWDRDNHRHDYRKPAKPDKPKPKKNKKDRDDRKERYSNGRKV